MNIARILGLGLFSGFILTAFSGRDAQADSCPGLTAPAALSTALTGVLYDPVAGVMKACVGNSWVSLGTGGGGALALAGLSDVSTTGIADGKALVYNGSTTKWEPQTISSGGVTSLSGLDDVDLAGIGNGKALVYNSASSKWVAQTISSGGTVSGTSGKIAKFTGANAVGDSVITESSGNIGIGTASPSRQLHIYAASGQSSTLMLSANSGGANMVLKMTDGSPAAYLTVEKGDGTKLMSIGSNGNVGVGTTAPAEKLDVNGSAKLNGTGTGNVPHACVTRTNTVTNNNGAVFCNTGEIPMSGGGVCSDVQSLRNSYPSGNSWQVYYNGGCTTLTIYAVCCKT